jgi:long-chain acyl-CoA synthetase
MIAMPRIRKRFQKEVDHFNKQFGEAEKIKSWDLMDAEWTFDTGEITPTMKLKRNFICKKYEDRIAQLFR